MWRWGARFCSNLLHGQGQRQVPVEALPARPGRNRDDHRPDRSRRNRLGKVALQFANEGFIANKDGNALVEIVRLDLEYSVSAI
mgnify:CR=1 FL=1